MTAEPRFNLSAFSLAGKTALVTGAARGIGRGLIEALAAAGATVIATGRDRAALAEVVSAIEHAGGRASARQLNVAQVPSIDAAFEGLAAEGVELDILVNNAGVEQVRPSVEVDEAFWDRIVDTNLKGAFFCSRAFARMPHRRAPRAIVNLCSLTSERGIPTAVPYGASKTGLVGMTRALSTEWAGQGIRVNGIGPGYFRTAMTEGFYDDQAWADRMLDRIPLGRFGALEDLMGSVVFLCSPAAGYITGQVLYVDGGILAAL